MKTTSTFSNFREGICFSFNTTYMGHEINLQVTSNNGLYCVSHNQKPIANIKIGDVTNTWYTLDKTYTASYLLDVVGNRIAAQLV